MAMERQRIILALLACSLCAVVCAVVAAAEMPSSALLSNHTCFGAKGDDFGYVYIPFFMPVSGVSITVDGAASSGVRCDTTSILTPFLCHDALSIGFACLPPNGASLRLVGFNESSAAATVTSLTLLIGRVLRRGMRCAVVYLEDFLDRSEDDNYGRTCVSVTALLFPVQGAEDPFAVFPTSKATAATPAWIWDSAAVALPSPTVDLPSATLRITSVTRSPRNVTASLTSMSVPSVFVADVQSIFMKVSLTQEEADTPPSSSAADVVAKCTAAAIAEGLLAPGSSIVRLPLVSSQSVNHMLLLFLSNETQQSIRIDNTSSFHHVAPSNSSNNATTDDLFILSNGTWSTTVSVGGAVTGGQDFVVCEIHRPSSSKTEVMSVLPGCSALYDVASCNSNAFCVWVAVASTCCPRSASNATGACHCNQPNLVLSTVAQYVNPTCNAMFSNLQLRNLVAACCSGIREVDKAETCRSDFQRCSTWSHDIVSLIDASMSYACESSHFLSCTDNSLQCTRHSIPAPSSTGANPNATTSTDSDLSDLVMKMNATNIDVSDVVSGNATLRLVIDDGGHTWNDTVLRLTTLEELRSLFEPAQYSKNGWVSHVVQTNDTILNSHSTVLEIQLGPFGSMLPETWAQRIRLTVPATFIAPPSTSDTVLYFTVVRPYRGEQIRKVTQVTSVISTAAGLASGAGGWIGLATTQSLMMMSGIGCTEATVRRLFPFAPYIVTPLRLIDGSFRFIFTVTAATLSVLFIVHVAIVPLSREVVWKDKMRSVWFPYFFMYFTAIGLLSLTEAAYTGLIDDRTPYVRVLFFLSDTLFSSFFAAVWNYGLRNGYEGYFERYGVPQGATRSDAVSAQKQARFGSYFKAREEAIRESIRSGRWRQDLMRFVQRRVLPTGHWPLARGFAVIREQCHDRGCYFVFVTAIFFFCVGIDAAHNSDDVDYCYAVYWNYCALLTIHIVFFMVYLPFRIPLLNFLFLVERVLELALYASAARWVWANDPAKRDGYELPYIAAAISIIQALMTSLVCIVTWIETIMWLAKKCKAKPPFDEDGAAVAEPATADIELPLLQATDGDTVHNSSQKDLAAVEGGVPDEQQRKSKLVQFHPVPEGWNAAQMLMLLNAIGSQDCEVIGRTAFVTMRTPEQARSVIAAFNGRVFRGSLVVCELVYESMFMTKKQCEKNPLSPVEKIKDRRSLL